MYNFLNEPDESYQFDLIHVFESIVNSIYFSLVTFTTIGFGDIFPQRIAPKIVVSLEIVSMMYLMYIGLNTALKSRN